MASALSSAGPATRTEPPPLWATRLIFGTYQQTGPALSAQVLLALSKGFELFDTAQLYRNERAVGALLRGAGSRVRATTKAHRAEHAAALRARVRASIAALGGAARVEAVLLHRPLAAAHFAALREATADAGVPAGVSNFRPNDLTRLCDALGPPAVNQVEVHPFVPAVEHVVRATRAVGARVEAHTVLAQGRFLAYPPLVEMSRRKGASPAQMLLRFAIDSVGDGGRVVVRSGNSAHLDELIEAAGEKGDSLWKLSAEELAAMRAWSVSSIGCPMRFYNHPPMPPVALVTTSEDVDEYVADVSSRLEADVKSFEAGDVHAVSGVVYALPSGFGSRQIKMDPVSRKIAERMFPSSRAAITEYIDAVKKLRGAVIQQEREKKQSGKGKSCALVSPKRVTENQGSVDMIPLSLSEAVLEPAAMPVTTAPGEELRPFFRFVASTSDCALPAPGGSLFVRGCLFPDGRMDMCKQVVGSEHIGELCDAVRASKGTGKVRHFLLGNNVSCESNPEAGAEAIASLMEDPELKIATWYLAGNAITPEAMCRIAKALETNMHAEALWLKRNPLKASGAAHVSKLLTKNRTLTLLDLDNTGLLDCGVVALLNPLLKVPNLVVPLRHLYLGACGISELGASSIALYLESSCGRDLETLYLSMNPLGDAGAMCIARALHRIREFHGRIPSLKRLSFASCRLTNAALDSVVLGASSCDLLSLDLGWYKATADMGEEPNCFTADSLSHLTRLISSTSSLRYLSLLHCGLSAGDLLTLREVVRHANPRLWFEDGSKTPLTGGQEDKDVRAGIRHPECVRNIDSMYRGKA